MNGHICLSVAVFVISATVAFACDTDKITECTQEMTGKAMKITQEITGGGDVNIDNLKKNMCDLGESFLKCISPATKGCGKDMDDGMKKALQMYNNDPFNCNIKLGAGTVVATTLTIFIAAIFAAKFN